MGATWAKHLPSTSMGRKMDCTAELDSKESSSKKLNDDVVVFMSKFSETEEPRYTARLKTYVAFHRKRRRAAGARRHTKERKHITSRQGQKVKVKDKSADDPKSEGARDEPDDCWLYTMKYRRRRHLAWQRRRNRRRRRRRRRYRSRRRRCRIRRYRSCRRRCRRSSCRCRKRHSCRRRRRSSRRQCNRRRRC